MNNQTLKKMKPNNGLTGALTESAAWTAFLTFLFLLLKWNDNPAPDMLLALPFFIILYFLLFSVGRTYITEQLSGWISSDLKKSVVLPAALIVLYFAYVLINGQNPFRGTLALFPYLIFFPVLVFSAQRKQVTQIDWLDFAAFVIFLLPTTLIDFSPKGNLPFNGSGFDSVFRIVIMLTAVYAFGTLRGLTDIGFYPSLSWSHFKYALLSWLVFYSLVLIIGYSVGFIQIVGHDSVNRELVTKIVVALVVTFLHTALFEELFFRGILQNMLAKRIGQSGNWPVFWSGGVAILIPLALLVGYTLKGGMQWFPALVTVLLFAAARGIEKMKISQSGVYTSLAITSVVFGLVHYHSGSIVYIGFACMAGWAYGYTYIKTRNVFYCTLVHTLVNVSALMFGLELMK